MALETTGDLPQGVGQNCAHKDRRGDSNGDLKRAHLRSRNLCLGAPLQRKVAKHTSTRIHTADACTCQQVLSIHVWTRLGTSSLRTWDRETSFSGASASSVICSSSSAADIFLPFPPCPSLGTPGPVGGGGASMSSEAASDVLDRIDACERVAGQEGKMQRENACIQPQELVRAYAARQVLWPFPHSHIRHAKCCARAQFHTTVFCCASERSALVSREADVRRAPRPRELRLSTLASRDLTRRALSLCALCCRKDSLTPCALYARPCTTHRT